MGPPCKSAWCACQSTCPSNRKGRQKCQRLEEEEEEEDRCYGAGDRLVRLGISIVWLAPYHRSPTVSNQHWLGGQLAVFQKAGGVDAQRSQV